MQAKGTHTGGGGSADPAICLYLAMPVYGDDGNGNQVQVSFDIHREQIKVRGGSGAAGRDVVFLKNVLVIRQKKFKHVLSHEGNYSAIQAE